MCVLDGWGEAPADRYNAINVAETPTLDALKKGTPGRWRTVHAHGHWVGLPTDEDMGNSEVGHNALGVSKALRLLTSLVQVFCGRVGGAGGRCCAHGEHGGWGSRLLQRHVASTRTGTIC